MADGGGISLNSIQNNFNHYEKNAFINGKYKEAEELYIQANKLEPSSALNAKISKARTLKDEFAIIDDAIRARDYNKANSHLNTVLSIDPGNMWVNEKRNQMKQQQKDDKIAERRARWDFDIDWSVFGRPFSGKHHSFELERGRSVSLGLGTGAMVRLSQFDYRYFPYTIDYYFIYVPSDRCDQMHSLGMGSAIILSDRWSLDYGAGILFSLIDFIPTDHGNERYVGLNIRGGVTYRCCKDHLWLSHQWYYGFAKNYPYSAPIGSYFVITGAL